MDPFVTGLLLILGLLAADASAQPRQHVRLRSWAGTGMLLCTGAFALGICVLLTGALTPSIVLVVLLAGVISLISNIKRQVLGEPLVFTDFALVGAVFQHPHFYVSALKPWQIGVIGVGIATVVGVVSAFSTGDMAVRAGGMAVMIAAGVGLKALLAMPRWIALTKQPDVERDVGENGLIATLVVYWRLWARLPALAPAILPGVDSDGRQLVVVIQCESFGDPAELFDHPGDPLQGLAKAQALAWQKGRLMVSGFGAYTMRTEFGAIFGIGEEQLGLRRFDPFLTAKSAAKASIAHRLSGTHWSRVFLHPHDMRFYGRDRLMPAAGFDTLVDEEAFAARDPSDGRYVTDAALCAKLLEIAAAAETSTLIYAVTIENHGPWSASEGNGERKGAAANRDAYLRLLRNSDAMLLRLIDRLPRLGRPTTLCFFGDHRPSIPKVCIPGGDRHTPFVILRFNEEGIPIVSSDAAKDLTPAQMHHEILRAVASG